MTVETPSDAYRYWSPIWRKCRDVAAGEEAVHAAGATYLPKLGGQDQPEYDAYKARAGFYNATRRTIDGLSGMIFRKPIVTIAPVSMDDWVTDIDLAGASLDRLAEQTVEELLTTTRCGVLVDMPRLVEGERVITRAQAREANQRPFARLYGADDILDLRVGQRNNAAVVTHVRLRETSLEPKPTDEFDDDTVQQIRVLDFNEDGQYRQRVYRASEDGPYTLIDEVTPLAGGAPMDEIPFVPIGARGVETGIDYPVLLDLVNVNLSHYRTLADLEHGAHFVALPTPYVFGVDDDHAPSSIGPTEIWHGPDKAVVVGLLEFTGQGLEGLERRREAKEAQMAALGARMLAPDKAGVEAAETLAIRSAGEWSVLASLAKGAGQALTRVVQMMADWSGVSGDVSVELNRDFMPSAMTAQQLTAWMGALQGGGVSRQTFFEALKQGELVRDDLSFEEEEQRISDDGPALGMIGADGDDE